MTVLKCMYVIYTSICGNNWHDGNKHNLRTIEGQIVQRLKNNEHLPKFTGSYKKKVYVFALHCIYFLFSL